jgi:hypothetical protein
MSAWTTDLPSPRTTVPWECVYRPREGGVQIEIAGRGSPGGDGTSVGSEGLSRRQRGRRGELVVGSPRRAKLATEIIEPGPQPGFR